MSNDPPRPSALSLHHHHLHHHHHHHDHPHRHRFDEYHNWWVDIAEGDYNRVLIGLEEADMDPSVQVPLGWKTKGELGEGLRQGANALHFAAWGGRWRGLPFFAPRSRPPLHDSRPSTTHAPPRLTRLNAHTPSAHTTMYVRPRGDRHPPRRSMLKACRGELDGEGGRICRCRHHRIQGGDCKSAEPLHCRAPVK